MRFPKPTPKPKKARRPLARTWIKRKRPKRLSREGSDPAYLQWVRGEPCLIAPKGYVGIYHLPCIGSVHPHHAIHLSQGGKDRDAVPLCMAHHRQWHDHNGVFRGMNRMQRWAWSVKAISDTQAAYKRAA